MIEEYDGTDVVDRDGNKIGTVDQTYVDDSGKVQFVEVKTGTLFGKHKLIPVHGGQLTNHGLQVPYTKDVVDGSPDIPLRADTLEGDILHRVWGYYDLSGAGAATEEEGEAAAVPVSERGDASDARAAQPAPPTAAADIAGTAIESDQQLGAVRDLGDVIEVPIVEEVLVKKPVVREVVRIRKRQVSETRTVGGELRKEDLEVDAPAEIVKDGDPGSP